MNLRDKIPAQADKVAVQVNVTPSPERQHKHKGRVVGTEVADGELRLVYSCECGWMWAEATDTDTAELEWGSRGEVRDTGTCECCGQRLK